MNKSLIPKSDVLKKLNNDSDGSKDSTEIKFSNEKLVVQLFNSLESILGPKLFVESQKNISSMHLVSKGLIVFLLQLSNENKEIKETVLAGFCLKSLEMRFYKKINIKSDSLSFCSKSLDEDYIAIKGNKSIYIISVFQYMKNTNCQDIFTINTNTNNFIFKFHPLSKNTFGLLINNKIFYHCSLDKLENYDALVKDNNSNNFEKHTSIIKQSSITLEDLSKYLNTKIEFPNSILDFNFMLIERNKSFSLSIFETFSVFFLKYNGEFLVKSPIFPHSFIIEKTVIDIDSHSVFKLLSKEAQYLISGTVIKIKNGLLKDYVVNLKNSSYAVFLNKDNAFEKFHSRMDSNILKYVVATNNKLDHSISKDLVSFEVINSKPISILVIKKNQLKSLIMTNPIIPFDTNTEGKLIVKESIDLDLNTFNSVNGLNYNDFKCFSVELINSSQEVNIVELSYNENVGPSKFEINLLGEKDNLLDKSFLQLSTIKLYSNLYLSLFRTNDSNKIFIEEIAFNQIKKEDNKNKNCSNLDYLSKYRKDLSKNDLFIDKNFNFKIKLCNEKIRFDKWFSFDDIAKEPKKLFGIIAEEARLIFNVYEDLIQEVNFKVKIFLDFIKDNNDSYHKSLNYIAELLFKFIERTKKIAVYKNKCEQKNIAIESKLKIVKEKLDKAFYHKEIIFSNCQSRDALSKMLSNIESLRELSEKLKKELNENESKFSQNLNLFKKLNTKEEVIPSGNLDKIIYIRNEACNNLKNINEQIVKLGKRVVN